MASLKPVFKYFEARTPEAFTEVQEYTMTWHFQSCTDEEFAEVQAGDLQAHLVKVSGHAPVEVSLDMKRVEVRPYGVSKGAAIAAILERIEQQRVEIERGEAERNLAEADNSPSHVEWHRMQLDDRADEGSAPAANGVSAADSQSLSNAAPAQPKSILSTSSRSDAAREGSARLSVSLAPDPAAASGESSGAPTPLLAPPSAVHTPATQSAVHTPFRWVFCASEVISRDEDLFSNLQQLRDEPGGDGAANGGGARVFTCCVGKTLSQADFNLSDSNEMAGLLDLLAHASVDHRAESCSALNISPTHNAEGGVISRADLPSTLERLHQLVKVLAGKQLLFLFDYDGVRDGGFLANPSPAMAKFLALYPAAVVQRNTVVPADAASGADGNGAALTAAAYGGSLVDSPSLGAISGVQIVSYGKPHSSAAAGSAQATAISAAQTRSSHEMVVHEVIDSYGPALQACQAALQSKFEGLKQVAVEDNTFSLTVTHRGADEDEVTTVRKAVAELMGEFPMLRAVEERIEIDIRPEAGWNRARLVEWIVSQVVEDVAGQLGHRGIMPIYLGEDPAFRHLSAIDGLDIMITGGPAIDSYFLRSAMQVDQLLRWFAEQHAAGVTVRGGKLRPSKQQSQPDIRPHKGKPGVVMAADGRERTAKRVQIRQQDAPA